MRSRAAAALVAFPFLAIVANVLNGVGLQGRRRSVFEQLRLATRTLLWTPRTSPPATEVLRVGVRFALLAAFLGIAIAGIFGISRWLVAAAAGVQLLLWLPSLVIDPFRFNDLTRYTVRYLPWYYGSMLQGLFFLAILGAAILLALTDSDPKQDAPPLQQPHPAWAQQPPAAAPAPTAPPSYV